MQIITSKENETIKQIKKLKDKKYRDMTGQFLIEGLKMVKEAIQEGAVLDKIIICEECIQDGTFTQNFLYEIAKYDCIYVTKKVMESITDVVTPQGILAVVYKKGKEEEIDYKQDILLVLDGIQDPGNLGTILRTADSMNLKQIILSEKTADPYNPKVVRSTMGAIFRVAIIQSQSLMDTLKNIKRHKFKVMATSLQTDNSIYDVDYRKKAIVIGNEANGVSKEVFDLADEKVKIPMLGKTESLNASVATGIILYEYVRRVYKEK